MTDLLCGIASLPQIGGSLSVEVLALGQPNSFCLVRADTRPKVAVALVQGGAAEGYARLLSGAPAMLDLLATALLRWEGQVQADTEIDGGDAIEWLARFTAEVREVLQAMVGPLAPGRLP